MHGVMADPGGVLRAEAVGLVGHEAQVHDVIVEVDESHQIAQLPD